MGPMGVHATTTSTSMSTQQGHPPSYPPTLTLGFILKWLTSMEAMEGVGPAGGEAGRHGAAGGAGLAQVEAAHKKGDASMHQARWPPTVYGAGGDEDVLQRRRRARRAE